MQSDTSHTRTLVVTDSKVRQNIASDIFDAALGRTVRRPAADGSGVLPHDLRKVAPFVEGVRHLVFCWIPAV